MEKTLIPRPEHPRPMFKRENWQNLNGEWDFKIDNEKCGEAKEYFNLDSFDSKITVPFCPESKLSGIQNTDFMYCVWYKRKVTLPDDWRSDNKRTFLNIGACDYETTVYINGNKAGTHFGGYTPIRIDITPWLVEGENDITVCAKDNPQDWSIPSGKQSARYNSFSCYYTRTTGIWQTVWLENKPNAYIKSLKITPSLKNGTVFIEAKTENADGLEFSAVASYKGKEICRASATAIWRKAQLVLNIDEIHPWDTENPDLYDVTLTLGEDTVKSYFGLRDIVLKDNITYLNGKPVFQRLILDQGFYPDGIYTAPTEDELIADIQRSLDMGFNGARLHQKVFEPRFLYHCDRMGYLVWGEHASWGMETHTNVGYKSFVPEWIEILQRDYNHPALIGWCPLNETSGIINCDFVKLLHQITMDFDPTRIFIDCSGWCHVEGAFDMYDVHDYANTLEKYQLLIEGKEVACVSIWRGNGQKSDYVMRNDVCFVSEFGGIGFKMDGGSGWGYGEAANDSQALIDRYKTLVDALLDNPKITAFCYTQLTDVEQEQNGLYTYDRIPKVSPELIKQITSRKAAIEK